MKKVFSSLAVVGLCASLMLINPTAVQSGKAQSVDPSSGIGTFLYPKLTDEEKEELLKIASYYLYEERSKYILENARERMNIGETGDIKDNTEDTGYNNRWGIDNLTEEEKQYLADIVWLEAGNQGLVGQELVVVTILNRTIDESFNDNVVGVLSQGNGEQFNTWPNRWKAEPTDETYQAIEDVLSGEADEEIINAPWLYFNTSSGTYKYKGHWFH